MTREIIPAPGVEVATDECPHEVVAGRLLGGFEIRIGADAPWEGIRMPDVDAWCVTCGKRPPDDRIRRWLSETLHRFPSARAARRLFGATPAPGTRLEGGDR